MNKDYKKMFEELRNEVREMLKLQYEEDYTKRVKQLQKLTNLVAYYPEE